MTERNEEVRSDASHSSTTPREESQSLTGRELKGLVKKYFADDSKNEELSRELKESYESLLRNPIPLAEIRR
jgi:hypothetical protein